MRKIFLVMALALSVGACAKVNAAFTPTNLAAVESGYGVALSGAVTYKRLCVSRQIPSSCRTNVVKMQQADAKAIAAIRQARVLRTYASVLNAQVAVSNFQQVQSGAQ